MSGSIDPSGLPVDERMTKALQELLNEVSPDLESIEPERALELYLDDRARECRKSTISSHKSRLGSFIDWCRDQELDDLTELSTRDIRKFQLRRREEVGVNTEKTLMDTLRVFLRWCERIDAVQPGFWKCAKPPNVPDEKKASDRVLHREEALPILDHLAKYEYASIEHVAWLLLVETGVRLGALRALDVEDYRSDCEPPYVEIVHRPETDTPIKNGSEGERWIGLSDEACEIVDDYLAHQRPDVTDSYDREPLLATAQGRVAKTTIRKYIYKWSRPCEIGLECPHDRVPEECTAATDIDRASKCPSSLTPHPIRRGYITYLLLSGVEIGVVCARCNVSPAIIEQHYDVRSEEDKMRQRQDVLREILNQPMITRSTPKIRDNDLERSGD